MLFKQIYKTIWTLSYKIRLRFSAGADRVFIQSASPDWVKDMFFSVFSVSLW